MRGDGSDYEECELPPTGDIELAALSAIHTGSTQCITSPFLHASLNRAYALAWLRRAQQGQARVIHPDKMAHLVRIDLANAPPSG